MTATPNATSGSKRSSESVLDTPVHVCQFFWLVEGECGGETVQVVTG